MVCAHEEKCNPYGQLANNGSLNCASHNQCCGLSLRHCWAAGPATLLVTDGARVVGEQGCLSCKPKHCVQTLSLVNTQNPSQEVQGEEKVKKRKALLTEFFGSHHARQLADWQRGPLGRGGFPTLKDSKNPPPPPPPAPFSILSSSPPRPIIDWLLRCSSSYRVSNRAERVRS